MLLNPVVLKGAVSSYYQIRSISKLDLTEKTIAGVNVFDFSEGSPAIEMNIPGMQSINIKKEVYKCPKGHTIGLNLLSEPYVKGTDLIGKEDIFESRQKIGVKRGLLKQEPIYLCSPTFRKMVIEEKLTGIDFEIAYVDQMLFNVIF